MPQFAIVVDANFAYTIAGPRRPISIFFFDILRRTFQEGVL
jgi:hypothetical protein